MESAWNEEELSAAVCAYREMQRMERHAVNFKKSDVYRDLAAAYGRTAKAFEYRMQNISAVLDASGQPWVAGLLPAKNVGLGVSRRLQALLGLSGLAGEKPSDVAAYRQKLPAMRNWLIGIARNRSVVRYGDLMSAFDVDRFSLRHALSRLGHQSQGIAEPILTALVVSKATGHCSSGLAKEFGVRDDAKERAKLYVFWASRVAPQADTHKSGTSLNDRAAKFASVEVRPDQAAFRRAVFRACEGRCAISGCDVPEALDAAHKNGCDWRLGHNGANDGYLLRKDLHALYDRRLLTIDDNGLVKVKSDIDAHYGHLNGTCVNGLLVSQP